MPLKRKGVSRTNDFRRALEHIEELVPKNVLDAELDRVASEIRKVVKDKTVAIAWSGGKDSQALIVAAEAAKLPIFGVISMARPLELPIFNSWVDENRPRGVQVYSRDDLDLPWLAAHPRQLFPRNYTDGYFWTREVTHWGQREFYRHYKLDLMLYGRRSIDGNFIGPDGLHVNKAGVAQYCPIRDWSHEMVLAAMHYYGKPFAPAYSMPEGFTTGVSPWPGRARTKDDEDGWRQTYEVDPSVVRQAALFIDSARAFLDKWNL